MARSITLFMFKNTLRPEFMFVDHLEKDDIDTFQTLFEESLKALEIKELTAKTYNDFLEEVAELDDAERVSESKLAKFEARLSKHLGIQESKAQ